MTGHQYDLKLKNTWVLQQKDDLKHNSRLFYSHVKKSLSVTGNVMKIGKNNYYIYGAINFFRKGHVGLIIFVCPPMIE